MSVAIHAKRIGITAFVYLFYTFRYLSRVPQDGLTIMLLLSPLAGQALLQLCPQLRYVLYGYACTFQSRHCFASRFHCCTSYVGQALLTDIVALMWVASCAV